MEKFKKIIKKFLHLLFADKYGYTVVKILGGLAKGTKIKIDITLGGSYWLGTYDEWIFNAIDFRKYIKPGMIVWDCGAFYGYYTAVFRNLVGESGTVVTFEASSKNYNVVKTLPELNKWSNVYIHHYAIGPESSELQFTNNLGGSNGPVGLSKTYSDQLEIETVKCYGVDEACSRLSLAMPDFIKFDLESAEEYALFNGHVVFSKKRPLLLLELHGRQCMDAAGVFLEKYHYYAHTITDFSKKINRLEAPSDFYRFEHVPHMLFCIPKENN